MDEFSLSVLLFLVLIGFLAAFVDAVVGGGGLIAMPALLFTGMSPQTALGTNKLAGTMGSGTSMISFLRHGQINKRLVFTLFPLAFVGSVLGVIVVQRIPPDILEPIILILLVVVTIYTLVNKNLGSLSTFQSITRKVWIVGALVAVILGFYDGFLGPGTGSFLLFAFIFLGFNFVEAAGNAKVLNFASNIGGLLAFIWFDSIHYAYGLPMGAAMIAGAYVGANVAIKKGSAYVKMLFIIVTIALIAKNAWDYLM
ncbi:sulfite exporter TauE/SafE family protein [Marinococcus luteus]|uniref:sulfite exporter TauE/SafE family protein n=1 Tax=Marinococcus luteus TaxID=1122204 RepID=UPI002ACC42AB|nr:TSUP family transporter [Marinococcus luteus]MDZ5784053.1 TSUP family transporter [Marinococcus luteus]